MRIALWRFRFLFAGSSVVFLVILGISFLIASIDQPLGRDQGIFAWVGQTVLRGGLPYVDAWDNKGPAAHALYALAIAIFGHSEQGVRWFDFAFNLLAFTAFLRIGWLLGRPVAGLMAFAFAAIAGRASWWDTAQPDGWAGILLVWSSAILLAPRLSPFVMAGSSILIGVAALIKPVYILFGLMPLLRFYEAPHGERRPLLFITGMTAGLLPFGLLFSLYASRGQFGAIWETQIEFNFGSYLLAQPASLISIVPLAIRGFALNSITGTFVLFAAIGLSWVWRRDRIMAAQLTTGVMLGAVCALVQLKLYSYHFLPYLYQLAIPAGFGFAAVMGAAVSTVRPPAFRIAAFLMLMIPCVMLGRTALGPISTFEHLLGLTSEDTRIGTYDLAGFNAADTRSMAQFVSTATSQGDVIYVWGWEASIYFLANRNSASRFGFSFPLVVGSPAYKEKCRLELMLSLQRAPPRLILVEDNDATPLTPYTSREYLEGFPELKSFLAQNYLSVSSNAHYTAYSLR